MTQADGYYSTSSSKAALRRACRYQRLALSQCACAAHRRRCRRPVQHH
jgi:hypothetical protein